MSSKCGHLQCFTDMPCMAITESLRASRCCNDAFTGSVTETIYGGLIMIQRGRYYRYQYRVIVGVSDLEIVTV